MEEINIFQEQNVLVFCRMVICPIILGTTLWSNVLLSNSLVHYCINHGGSLPIKLFNKNSFLILKHGRWLVDIKQ